jgi:hypothetical protein
VIRRPALIAWLALVPAGAGAAGDTPLATGAEAPDTTLVDQRGRSVHLAELLGQRDFVVVAFYVKAFTGG